MSESSKIQAHHLSRQALVYVRQSTPAQVAVNRESTLRQYALADKALALGWPQPLIKVIDDDLGLSGVGSAQRAGFQGLVAAIGLGEVGMILVTEVSRLSRLNSDWHRVIELSAVFQTLIADEDGVYDPRGPNDRLLLGLKGTLFAAELQIIQARMRGGLLNKARRGELAVRLPVGYRRQPDGTVVKDPDERVRGALNIIFERFSHLGSARAVQRYFHDNHLLMPRLIHERPDRGQLSWVSPAYHMIHYVLDSPVYAGMFVYGRRQTQIVAGNPPQTQVHRLPMDEWEIAIPDVYPAYISYDQYLANRRALADNQYNFMQKSRGATREGRALLQGLLVCGRCGRHMTPAYRSTADAYVCRRDQTTYALPRCQSFPRRQLDDAVSEIFLEAVQPGNLETSLAALALLAEERQALDRHWQQRIERARYEVRLAERQYDAADPDNRLVAHELEKRWDEALQSVSDVEQEYARMQRTDLAPLNSDEQRAIQHLANDLPALWTADTTTPQDRKRLLRLAIQEVTVTVDRQTRTADYVIWWVGGATTGHTVRCAPIGWHCATDAGVVERIRVLAATHSDYRIAEVLNGEGLRTRTGKPWTYERVLCQRIRRQIPTGCPLDPTSLAPRGDGLLSVRAVAERLNVSPASVNLWIIHGVLAHDQRVNGSKRWVRLDSEDVARLDGSFDGDHLPTIHDVMATCGSTAEDVWQLVRDGQCVAYRVRKGNNWQWRIEQIATPEREA